MSRAWMPLYVADYLADTAHLNAAQSGAYLHLIMHYWQNGGLPEDEASLRRISRLTSHQWARDREVLSKFFVVQATKNFVAWRHKRVDAELQKSAEISQKRRASAKQMHSKRSAKAHTITITELSIDKSIDNNSRASPRDELLSVLDIERADAVLSHRKALRKPLTQRAAKMLAQEFAETSDPNAAADLMIARGWLGFQSEWYYAATCAGEGGLDATLRALGEATERRIAERERQVGAEGGTAAGPPQSPDERQIVPFRPPKGEFG